MIVDCHGHHTTVPAAHAHWRQLQLRAFDEGTRVSPYPVISDDEIREPLEESQLRLIRERGTDLTLFSPRASAMGHHLGDVAVSQRWADACNNLIKRVVDLYPDHYLGVCQLPQAAGVPVEAAAAELDRCVTELGFVGCILNPDPSGGYWTAPPLTDPYWYPLYERLAALDVPAMIHPSASANPAFQGTGDHYLNADTTAFMQLVQGSLFQRFPTLRLILPHGGGAVPFHWGRFRGLADMLAQPPITDNVLPNVFFDTCVYHQAGIDLLFAVIDHDHILFGSEMVGAVRGIDPTTGFYFDDTRRYVDALNLDDDDAEKVYAANACRVFPRLDSFVLGKKVG
jgi:4-oxalmesaconate hydratase